MTKKERIRNEKKKVIVIAAFMVLLLIISVITTVTILHFADNNELGSKEENILYYNEDKKQEKNNVLIVGIEEKNEEDEKSEKEGPEETNQTKTTNNTDNKANTTTNNNTKKVADTPYYIKVNYKANVVTVYKKDDSGKYTKAVKAMVCSCGDATPTSGVYSISDKYTWRLLQGNVYGQYACRITGHILFHSVPYTKKDKSSLEWWEYDKLGTSASLGCVRLTVKDVKWIYDNCVSGTQVEFYGDSNPGPLGKPTAQKISGDTEVRGWDPTDPDKSNPWPAYLKKKEENDAARAAEEASTKPVEDKTNTTNKTQETNTTPVENKTTETTKNNETNTANNNNSNTNLNTTKSTKTIENKTNEKNANEI